MFTAIDACRVCNKRCLLRRSIRWTASISVLLCMILFAIHLRYAYIPPVPEDRQEIIGRYLHESEKYVVIIWLKPDGHFRQVLFSKVTGEYRQYAGNWRFDRNPLLSGPRFQIPQIGFEGECVNLLDLYFPGFQLIHDSHTRSPVQQGDDLPPPVPRTGALVIKTFWGHPYIAYDEDFAYGLYKVD